MTTHTICCRLCGSNAELQFEKLVLNRYAVSYYKCSVCFSLMTENPYWLEEAYARNISWLDTGAIQRNLNNFALCYVFIYIFGVRNTLDYGASDGILCRLLRDHCIDAYAYDKHCQPLYAQNYTKLQIDHIDLMTVFEVFEHLQNPNNELSAIFERAPTYILFSTELYADQGPDWWYLAAEAGQHVFFYSEHSLGYIARKFGYIYVNLGSLFLFAKPCLSFFDDRIILAKTMLNGWVFDALKQFIATAPAHGFQNDYNELLRRSRVGNSVD